AGRGGAGGGGAVSRKGPAGERDAREEADERAGFRLGEDDPAEAAASVLAGDGAGVHRGRRAGGDHAEGDPAAEDPAEGERPQTGGACEARRRVTQEERTTESQSTEKSSVISDQ